MNPEILANLIKMEKAASPAPWDMDCLDSREAETSHYVMYDSDQECGKPIFDTSNAQNREVHDLSDDDGTHYIDEVARRNFQFIKTLRNHAKELLAAVALPKNMDRITAEDLFILCRRAAYALSKGRAEDAVEILSHAPRIGKRIGIEDKIIRAE